MAETVSGSLVLKRLKMGKVVYLSINAVGKPFFQGWNSGQGVAVPDFTVAGNQPVARPEVTSSDGSALTIQSGVWYYNGTGDANRIEFGDPVDGWAVERNSGRFALNPATHELKVVKNIAAADNQTTDTLYFTATGEADGTAYTVTGSIELRIINLGSSANSIVISLVDETGNDAILSSDTDTVKLKATTLVDGNPDSTGFVKWFGEDGKTQLGTGPTLNVTRAMVQGIGLIFARLYASSSSATVLASDAVSIRDVKDDMDVIVSLTDDSPSEWDGKTAMKVKGGLWRLRNGERAEEVDTSGENYKWEHDFRSSSLNTECGVLPGNPVTVTAEQWGKVRDFEDLVDFATCTIS